MLIKSTIKVTKGWPPARRKAQAARIRITKPWLHSTGPKTPEGKFITRWNAVTHGATTAHWRRLAKALRKQRNFIKEIARLREERERQNILHYRLNAVQSTFVWSTA